MHGARTKLVEAFYAQVWNERDARVAREILDPEFRFRGSLGPELSGVEAFLGYVAAVHAALGEYTCHLDELLEAGDRLAARLRFRGIHRGEFFGVPATGRTIEWAGAAFFTVAHGRLARLWVLGDVDAVRRQLGARAEADF